MSDMNTIPTTASRGETYAARNVLERMIDQVERKSWLRTLLLVGPAAAWMLVFLGIPLISVVIFGFWTTEAYAMKPVWNVENYVAILGNPTYWYMLGWTLFVTGAVVGFILLISLPVSYFLSRMVKSEAVKMGILLACMIPFWTSYLIRMVTWVPMFGRTGIINSILISMGAIHQPIDALLYSPFSMILCMIFLYIVFCIGPIYFFQNRIPQSLIDCAQNLGASPWKVYRYVELPLIMPGIVTGAFFTTVFVLGEFATERIIGGAQYPMFAGAIHRQVQYLQWPRASAISVVLMIVTLCTVAILFRLYDIRKEL